MSTQQFMIVLFLMLVFYVGYTLNRTNTKVYCTFIRRDKSVGHKWAKAKNGERIEFEKGWYYVVTKCITYDTTLFNLIPVRRLEFHAGRSSMPKDPDTGEIYKETPEMRKNLNKREDIEALEVGSRQAMGKQKATVTSGGWLPIILVLGIVVIGYFVYQMRGQIDSLGQAINVLQSMMMK